MTDGYFHHQTIPPDLLVYFRTASGTRSSCLSNMPHPCENEATCFLSAFLDYLFGEKRFESL